MFVRFLLESLNISLSTLPEPLDGGCIPSAKKTSISGVELDQIIEHISRSAKSVASPRYIEEIQRKLLYVSIHLLFSTSPAFDLFQLNYPHP